MARSLVRGLGRVGSVALGLCFGLSIIPLTAFASAMFLGTNIDYPLLLGVASVLNLSFLVHWAVRRNR